jgi:hypothetical protein
MLAHIEQPLVLISATYDMFLENCFRAANNSEVTGGWWVELG